MFNFLKEKLKQAVSKLTKGVEEKGKNVDEEEEVIVEKKPKASKAPAAKPKAKPKEEKAAPKAEKAKKEEEKPEAKTKPALASAKAEPRPISEQAKPEASSPEEKKGFFSKLKEKMFKKEEPSLAVPPVTEPEKEPSLLDEAKEEEAEAAKAITEIPEEIEAEEVAEEPEAEEVAEEGETEETPEEAPEEKPGFFQRLKEVVTKKTLSEAQFEELFWDLEVALLENNVAVEVIDKIKQDLKRQLVDVKVTRGKVEETIARTLSNSIAGLFDVPSLDLIGMARKKKPFIIAFVGVNGSGKTTTIAKLAKLFQDNSMKPIIAAADTFRAAAIQQLEEHANRLGVKLIKHDYGADPAAVAFDAIRYAEAHKADVVLIDTAGRLHSNVNLMDEMKKIMRVAKPDVKIFIGESITGNDCIEQAKQFNEAVGIDGIILCKADVDEKGGAAISVSYVTGKPILYLGTGQRYEDLQVFDSKLITGSLGLTE